MGVWTTQINANPPLEVIQLILQGNGPLIHRRQPSGLAGTQPRQLSSSLIALALEAIHLLRSYCRYTRLADKQHWQPVPMKRTVPLS